MAGTTKNAFLLNDLNLDSLNHVLGVIQREVDRVTGLLGEIIFRNTVEAPISRTTGTFRAAAGTVALPSYTFTADLDTGLYKSAANTLDFSVAGAQILSLFPTPSGSSSPGADFLADVSLRATTNQKRQLRFYELTGTGTNYVGFRAPNSIAANKIWNLPSADGNNGEFLQTNGSGALTFAAPAFAIPTGNIDIGDAAVEGTSTNATRSDHQHTFTAPTAGYPVDVAATEADGTATTPARSDHRHAFGGLGGTPPVGYPLDVAATEADGVATTSARSDHVHALGIGTTKGDVLARSSTVWTRLAVGTDAQVLTADAGQTPGVKWDTPSAGLEWEHSHNLWELIGHDGFDYDESSGQLWLNGAAGLRVDIANTTLNALRVISGGNVGVGTATPSAKFHVSNDGGTAVDASLLTSEVILLSDTAVAAGFTGVVAADGSTDRMVFKGVSCRGTLVAPTDSVTGDYLVSLLGAEYSNGAARAAAEIAIFVDGVPSSTSYPTRISFYVTAVGATARSEKMRFDNVGHLGIGTTTPSASTLLDLTSTTAALLVPRMTTVQKNALTAINGMLVYDSTLNLFQGYQGGVWAAP